MERIDDGYAPEANGTHQVEKPRTRGGYTRQRRGCVTCRQRKKKCDQVYPICGHCSRLNLLCKREAPRALPSSTAESAKPLDDELLTSSRNTAGQVCCQHSYQELIRHANLKEALLLGQPADDITDDIDLVSSRRGMLRYYTATLAIMLTTNLENNCFLSVLMPMAFECPSLMYALAAWSSSHLALRNEDFRQVSLKHRGLALAKLKSSMSDHGLSDEMCLAVTMVLCSMESISDGTDAWFHHLAGAAAVLGGKVDSRLSQDDPRTACLRSLEGRWLLRNFAYHDVLMSVSMDRRPFLSGDYWLSHEVSAADPYFGFAARILYLISESSRLNADLIEIRSQSAEGRKETECVASERARDIERQLQDWICPSQGLETPVAVLSEAYRLAALIYLYRILRRHLSDYNEVFQEKIASCVTSACQLAKRMPEGALAECTFLFPLFIAGGEAEEVHEIEAIRERLVTMNKWRRFRNVEACLEVLDEVWRLRSAGTKARLRKVVDWLDILQHRNWRLALT